MPPLDAALLRKLIPTAGKLADVYAPHIAATCAKYDIGTPGRIAAFLANVAVESAGLACVLESTYYRDPARLLSLFPHDFKDLADARAVQAKGAQAIANRIYANQNGNGPESSGDGYFYRGRGLAQVTGKNGYIAMGNGLSLDLIHHPELLEIPEHAASSAGLFWQQNRLNAYADKAQFHSICGIWNVGTPNAATCRINGFAERADFYARALMLLKTPSDSPK